MANADQTPVYLDNPYEHTVAPKGAKTVSIKTTGHEKEHMTVMLCMCADGTKLPPNVILKRKTMPRDTVPKGLVVTVQQKGWMDLDKPKDWIKQVWAKRPMSQKRALLVLDSFQAHRNPYVKKLLGRYKTDLGMIPGGLTCMLQPLDVSVNRPFKSEMKKLWSEWMLNGEHEYTGIIIKL